MSEWSSNEEILKFLECYQGEPCIWDPGHSDNKNKKKVADAWSRLSKAVGKSVEDLKIKKEILMVTFRKILKKKQECISSGEMNGIYQPNWFAYQLMESFLLPIYAVKWGLNSEMVSKLSETAVDDPLNFEPEETENDNSLAGPSTSATAVSAPFRRKSKDKSRRRPALDSQSVEQQMATAFNQLTNALNQRRSKSSDASNEDECDLYAKLLSKKLRELPKGERMVMMYEIDGLFIQKIKRRRFSGDSASSMHSSYSRPSSASSNITK